MNSHIPTTELKNKAFIGIDVHLSSYAVCVVEEGRHRRKWTMPTEPEKLVEKLL